MQTSFKRCGLKFSLKNDMSAKFPRGGGGGGGGEQDIFSLKSISHCMLGILLAADFNF